MNEKASAKGERSAVGEARHLTLSVTELVEFSARSGDLYPEGAGGPTALEGVLAHQKIQRERGPEWQRECVLKCDWPIDDWLITLQGRVDLLNTQHPPFIIEEIKTTLIQSYQLPPGKLALFWAQAKVYAGLYHRLYGAPTNEDELELRLTLVNLNQDEPECLRQTIRCGEAVAETERLLRIYLAWHCRIEARRARVRASAKEVLFPFAEYRPGQRALAADIYRNIRDGGALLAEAPTGTGKTITSLFPACKALGEALVDQVVYLTAKTTNQRQVDTTIEVLRDAGLTVDSLTLCAQQKVCPCRNGEEYPRLPDGSCAYTLGFWDRLPAARETALATENLGREALLSIGHQHQVCPSALAFHLAPWSTLVVGDYNYFFDPLTALNTFTKNGRKRALLVDELHNLPERARRMFSASLDSHLLRQLGSLKSEVRRKCRQIENLLQRLAEESPLLRELPIALTEHLQELLAQLQADRVSQTPAQTDWLPQGENDGHPDDAVFELYRFCVIASRFGEGHSCLITREENSLTVQLLCLDPAHVLQQCYEGQKAFIGFSATLRPLRFYQKLLGLPASLKTCALPYPFPPDNLLVLRCDYLDTRWQARATSLRDLVELLAHVIRARPGKYLVFFPSYDYLTTTYTAFVETFGSEGTVRQNPVSTPAEQAEFLRNFFTDPAPALGFAILGGIFAEGVDYLGDALHGAIVIGTGMPQPSREQSLTAEHFQARGLNPFEYAYQLPGFTRVLQTAGRVIRSGTDKGVVVLVDPRFMRPDYQKLMPEHWRPVPSRNAAQTSAILRKFWTKGA